MKNDVLLVKAVTGGAEAFFAGDEINGYNLNRDIPLPSVPVLDAWVTGRGYTTGFFDFDRNDLDSLLEKASGYDVIGFYLNFSTHFKVMGAVERVKKAYPEKLVIIGGPSIMNLGEDFYRLSKSRFWGLIKKNLGRYADAVVYGEGEIALETILAHKDNPDEIGQLIDNNDESSRGIIYNDSKGNLHISKTPGIVPDLNLLPVPNFALSKGLIPVAFIETSRGCPFKCPFCEMPALYDTRRLKSREQIEAEIDSLQQLGIKYVIITDPAIFPSRRMDMLSEIFAGRGMIWTGYAKPGTWKSSAPLYSRETLRKARESGCISLFFGGESASERTQEMYNKPGLDVLRQTERLCKEAGLLSCWSFMLLNPGETSRDIDDLIQLVTEMEPGLSVFSPFIVLPDSEIDRNPQKYGLEITDPDYKLRAADLYARFSKTAGVDKKERIRRLVEKYPRLMRFLLRLTLRKVNYFRCAETGFGLADGAFEMLRLDAALNRNTDLTIGKSNYRLIFEMAARDGS